ncbi:unnamed protein product [Prunus brigantina]
MVNGLPEIKETTDEKSKTFVVFKRFKALVEKQSGSTIKVMRSDRGGEYTSQEFEDYCKDEGIWKQMTASYSPQQNGITERKNRTIVKMATSMMNEKGLPKRFWAEAIFTAESIKKRKPFPQTPAAAGNNSNTEPISLNYSSSESPPLRTRSLNDIYETCNFSGIEPESFEEAQKHEVWVRAMKDEIRMIEKNQNSELVDLPKDKDVIGVKWIFKTKFNQDGSIQKHKARLVARSFTQNPGIDFFETFAPVARLETIRTLIALAAQKNWLIYQLDVKSAFLNGVLEEEVYVEQPQGFLVEGGEEKVYKLKKTLYGLKQAPRTWYAEIDKYFSHNGFQKSQSEPTLYILKKGASILVVSLYVDDLSFTGNDEHLTQQFKKDIMSTYEMSDLGTSLFFGN